MSGGQDQAAEMIDDGGPAFPNPTTCATDGMTLRDWFAGQAIDFRLTSAAMAASWAYEVADEMLKLRKAQPCTKAQ